jgi:hypothetical protein
MLEHFGNEEELMAATVVGTAPARHRLGLRLLAVIGVFVAAAAHIPVIPDHLVGAPYIGVLFIALSVVCISGGVVLLGADSRAAWIATGGSCALAVLALVVSRTIGLPQMADDVGHWGETWAVVSLVSESVVAVTAAYALATFPRD